ncbi:MAG: DMT family transporter, partial [Deltaproteobacteria bacterium]|nr:DMT family transporter [Deltaproteobacteria bacterium]
MTTKSALLLLIVTAVLWSTSGVLIKFVEWPALPLASARGLVAAVTMSFLLPGGFKPRNLEKDDFFVAVCLTVLCLCFVTGMKVAAAANVIVLQYTAPLWVAVMAPFFLRERTSGRDWMFMGIMFSGVVLFFLDGLTFTSITGNVLGLTSGLFFAFQAVFLRRIKNRSTANALILGNFLTFVVGFAAWGSPWPSLIDVIIVLLLGVFQMGVPYYLMTLAVPKVSSLDLVLVPMIEPILCPLWVFIFLDERPGAYALAGAVVVILS